MFSRGRNELCRICGGVLQGNQRRWLFGGQSRRMDERLAQSTQSSPWGSTLSLGSSPSLSTSQSSLGSPSKAPDLLSVLTHILGRPVARGSPHGEFVCGKCVSALERVFRFDSVIARVRVLSSERLQKLTRDRDAIRQWVRQSYLQRQPPGDAHGEAPRDGYREMLKDNMALSEYECWSEKWDTCPYFIKSGKRCRNGKGCEGCDYLRVPDSSYESVCGLPRHLPPWRERSQSVPLRSVTSSSPASLAGSSLSLRASVRSLDSLDGSDPFDSGQSVDFVLKELKAIEGRPVSSPPGSKIPVLGRKGGRVSGPTVNRVLAFGELENGGDEMDGEDGDVLTDLRDEFVPLHRESPGGRVHHAVRLLRGQLDEAEARIRTLEAELARGRSDPPDVNGSEDWAPLDHEDGGGGSVLQSLGHVLHGRERLVQECVALIRRLSVEEGAGAELADKLTENLREIRADNKAALERLRSAVTEKEKDMEAEIEALRKAARDRETDLITLSAVLQSNQDLLNDLRAALGEKEQLLTEAAREREVWKQRNRVLDGVQREKDAVIHSLKEALDALQQDVQGLGGEGAQLVASLKDREGTSATLCQEVAQLYAALQKYQDMVQDQQESHSQAVSSLTSQLADARQQLRLKEKEKKEADRVWQNLREGRDRDERQLRSRLEKRDKLIEQILVDAEERDQLLRELQQNLANRREAVKHTP